VLCDILAQCCRQGPELIGISIECTVRGNFTFVVLVLDSITVSMFTPIEQGIKNFNRVIFPPLGTLCDLRCSLIRICNFNDVLTRLYNRLTSLRIKESWLTAASIDLRGSSSRRALDYLLG
jgi:hypothetical protein